MNLRLILCKVTHRIPLYLVPTYGMNHVDAVVQNCKVIDLYEMNNDSDKYMIDVFLNGKKQAFEVDSGAKFTLLSENDFNKLQLDIPVIQSNLAFRSYTGNIIKPRGKVSVNVQYKDKEMMGELHIVPDGHDALLGRQWIRALQIELNQIDQHVENRCPVAPAYQIKSIDDDIIQRFPKVYQCVQFLFHNTDQFRFYPSIGDKLPSG
ncbi:hypothetical protein M8J77_023561 [Diaphorina citri]|nr:hypothetical protein M8J77_023561 [Diaphorina citri]